MIEFKSTDEIAEWFRHADRKNFWVPEELLAKGRLEGFRTWIHRSGHLGYVLADFRGRPVGFQLRRQLDPSAGTVQMCEWCKAVSGHDGVALFSLEKRDRTVGFYLCRDLDCEAKIRSLRPGLHEMRETISREQKLNRWDTNVRDFIRRYVLEEK